MPTTCEACKRPKWNGGHALNERECDETDGEVCRLHQALTRANERAEGLAKELDSAHYGLDVAADESAKTLGFLNKEAARADAATARVAELEKQLAEQEGYVEQLADDCHAVAQDYTHAKARGDEAVRRKRNVRDLLSASVRRGAAAEAELAAVLRGKDEMGERLARSLGVPAAPLSQLVDAASAELARLRALPDGFRAGLQIAAKRVETSWLKAHDRKELARQIRDLAPRKPLPSAQQILPRCGLRFASMVEDRCTLEPAHTGEHARYPAAPAQPEGAPLAAPEKP